MDALSLRKRLEQLQRRLGTTHYNHLLEADVVDLDAISGAIKELEEDLSAGVDRAAVVDRPACPSASDLHPLQFTIRPHQRPPIQFRAIDFHARHARLATESMRRSPSAAETSSLNIRAPVTSSAVATVLPSCLSKGKSRHLTVRFAEEPRQEVKRPRMHERAETVEEPQSPILAGCESFVFKTAPPAAASAAAEVFDLDAFQETQID